MIKMSKTLVTVKLEKQGKCILDWYAISVTPEQNFSHVFEAISQASSHALNVSRFKEPVRLDEFKDGRIFMLQNISGTEKNKIEVSWSLSVVDCVKNFGYNSILFSMVPKAVVNPAPLDAFDLLKEGQQKLSRDHIKYPDKIGSGNNVRGDFRLFNDIVDMLKENQHGFTQGCEKTSGKELVKAICDGLYYILPHLDRFKQRYITLPSYFKTIYSEDDSGSFVQTYNNPEAHKHKVHQLDNQVLHTNAQNLYRCLSYPFINVPRLKPLQEATQLLADACDKMSSYLQNNNQSMIKVHLSTEPIRQPGDGNSDDLRFLKGTVRTSQSIVDRYSCVEKLLNAKEPFFPVLLNDVAPLDRKDRYFFVKEIQLPMNVEIYSFHRGNSMGTLWFIWKSGDSVDMQKSNAILHQIEKDIPVYHTRAMKREFIDRYSLVISNKSVLNNVYSYLTGDPSSKASKVSRDVQARLNLMLQSGDTDLVNDLRAFNEGQPEKYDIFWDAIGAFINKYELQAVDDRRHGSIAHMGMAMSIHDLITQVKKDLPEDVGVPSVEWVRLQFWPKNAFYKNAVQYTGKFDLKFKVQSRQLDGNHVDGHYCAALFRYLKSFAVKYRDNAVMICMDDKNHIAIGEPGTPLAAVNRGKKVVVSKNVQFSCSDHDMNAKAKLTPSVELVCDIPENIDQSFYRGTVAVSLKDSIFEASSPMRHAAEIRQTVSQTGNLGKSIRILYSDGGPDHRVTYPSVQLSLMCMFILDDLDVLIAGRTAPMMSWSNPCEKIMCILNLGLQMVTVERTVSTPEFERQMQSLATMKAIRDYADKNEHFKENFMSCIKPVKESVSAVFERLSLKGTPFKVTQPASDLLIEEMSNSIGQIDASIVDPKSMTSKDVNSKSELQKFLKHCCTIRKYFFMIKKCGQVPCPEGICKQPRLPMDIFSTIHVLPGEIFLCFIS